jgi:hypothetical protein
VVVEGMLGDYERRVRENRGILQSRYEEEQESTEKILGLKIY